MSSAGAGAGAAGAAGINPQEILRQFDHDALEDLQPQVVEFALGYIQKISANNSISREDKEALVLQILVLNHGFTRSIRNLIALYLAHANPPR